MSTSRPTGYRSQVPDVDFDPAEVAADAESDRDDLGARWRRLPSRFTAAAAAATRMCLVQ